MIQLWSGWIIASLLSGAVVASLMGKLVPPAPRLAGRVRPYLHPVADTLLTNRHGGALKRLAGPLLRSLADRLGHLLDSAGDEAALVRIKQSALFEHLPEEDRLAALRLRQLGSVALATGLGAGGAIAVGMPPARVVAATVLGAVVGATRQRGRVDRAIENRRTVMRIEVYTIAQLLAMRIKAGGGVIFSMSEVVARGRGEVVTELSEALRLHRAGMTAAEAFAKIAAATPEPFCARAYRLLAVAEERGADLAGGLLALGEDVREARREAIRRTATRRRAAMLIPTIAVLAPVMLLFVGAPLPSLLLSWR